MNTVAVVAGVVVFVIMLVWRCVTAAREAKDAKVELNERIGQLKEVASSMSGTGAARVIRTHLPIRRILERVKDELSEPQTGRP